MNRTVQFRKLRGLRELVSKKEGVVSGNVGEGVLCK
jgi:hypothetical protein